MLGAAESRAASIGRGAVLALGLTLLLRLLAQGVAMHGAGSALDLGLLGPMIVRTTWGIGWLLQLAGVVVAAFGFHAVRAAQARSRKGETPRTHASWRLAGVGVILLAFSPAFSGHAASAPKLRALAILADGLHVLGASSWLGTLAVVLFAGVTAAASRGMDVAGPFVRDMVNAFSPVALVSAGVAATTGVFAAWLHVGTVPNLWGSRYGLILLLKLGILSIVAFTGFYNWRFVKPRLGSGEAAMHLRRSARVEVAVALLVLLVTAVLVASPTAMDMTM
jgi:copper transport protein